MDANEESGMGRAFAAAMRAADETPESNDAWDHLEELADKLRRPDEVTEVYRAVLARRLPREVFTRVAERAVRFQEDFGDEPDRITALLSTIIERDPSIEWAFERLSLMLTSSEQWDELLDVYDRTLAHVQDSERRRRVLHDAAQAARDFAGQPERAARYMQQLLALEPQSAGLWTSLERLLEKSERWTDLIDLWESRIVHLSQAERRETQMRIAACWLDRLGDAQRALDVASSLLTDHPGFSPACELTERVFAMRSVELATRRQALSILRKSYLFTDRPDDVVRVLEQALGFVEAEEARPLHREAASRLAVAGRDVEAIAHYRELLLADPTDADARKQLRQLAKRSRREDLHAQALVDAALAASDGALKMATLAEAAHLRHTALEDAAGAVELYSRVLESPETEPSVALVAAHSLNELLATTDRASERLAVLERLAALERSSAVRRHALGEAARLADRLGDVERALANWKPVLEQNAHDQEALAAVITLLERRENWDELISVLKHRASAPLLPQQRRADLVRIAEVQERVLGRLEAAIETWLLIRHELGEDNQLLSALDGLMSQTDRYRELAVLLGEAAGKAHGRSASLLVRLGDIHRVQLEDEDEALRWYARAAAIDPRSAAARAGLQTLIDNQRLAGDAAEALARVYEFTGEWRAALQLLEPRLEAAATGVVQARLLREAAGLHLKRGEDAGAAFECLCRALPLEPDNLATEYQLTRLAQHTGRWAEAAEAIARASESVGDAASRAGQLRKVEAAIRETWLDDSEGALRAYRVAAETLVGDAEAFEAVSRCAARVGKWDVAAEAAMRSFALRDRVSRSIMSSLESGVKQDEDWRALANALEAALSETSLRSELAMQLEMTIAQWLRDRCQDFDAAERAARRAVEHTPTRLETLELYASLQRRAPGPALVDTLLRIDRLVVDSLDVLHEAALVAGERVILEQLYRKAAGMWLRGENAAGAQQPNEVAPWALDRLVEHYVAANDVPRAVRTLLEGTRLPFEDDTIVELQRRAAELSAASGNKRRAIDVYRGLLDERPSDLEAMRRAAELCEQEGHLSEALALHMRELDLVDDPDRRLELRLQFSRLASALEKQGGRAAWLRANLDERPGHEPSIEELVSTLEARGKHDELADELGEQARMLELKQQPARAAQLWTRVAALAEEPLGDGERAIAAHTRVVELACTNDTLDALARLHLSRQEPAKAAAWLERRLEAAAAGDRVAVLLKLAHARIQADRRDGAVAALSLAFEEAPRNAEVRKLLLGLHRQNKDWASLADTLTRAALCIGDERTIVSYAREAAAIYVRTLGVPDAAVPVLRRAVELEPDDAELRGMLAEGLRVAGDLDEARRLLEGLVKDFGRRRLPERAYVHLQLARVAKAQGRTDEALDELETAARMDAGSVTVLKELAELARQTGHLERAERAYRTLLVTVRREPNPETLLVGPTEVLLELSRIASDRQDDVKASELSESALESLVAHDFEAERIQNKLRARKDWTLCERVLRRRLVHVTTTHKRARVHADLGDLLMVLGRKEEAFDERIAAVRTDPGSPLHHEAARDLALALGRLDAYVSAVEALLSDERADTSAHVRCELFLRLGEVLEKERRDFTRAQSLYAHAADTGVRRVDVWRAQARLAEALGDSEEYARFSGLLAEVGEDRVESGTDALYRRAEVQLASSETLEEGVTSLREALDDAFRGELAAMILLRATDQHPEHVGLLELYEQVARRGGDDHVLLHYLERRAMHPSATPEQAREAVDKALELGDLDRAETLMSRAAEMGRSLNRADDLRRVEWALLGLAERRLAAGDLAGAVKWLSEAAEVASLDVLFAITQRVAERAGRPGGDLTLAAKPYERLLERAPSDERAWRPLAEIYARLGEVDQLERIVEETCDGLEDASDRSALRLSLARALLEKSQRADDAVEHLKRVLIDEPQHAEAHALLTSHLERAGRSGELSDLLRQQLRAAEERRDEAAVRIASLDLARRLDESEREEALTMLRSALRWVPEDPEILEALYTRLGPQDDARERAQIAEALLRVAAPETAGDRALELVAMYDALEDQEGALRALALGTQRAPGDKRLRELLLERYRARGDFLGLAETLIAEAQSTEEPQRRAALFIAAARVRRDELGDPAGAAPLLAQAFELAPSDQELCIELARTQSSAGSNDEALATLGAALQKNTKPEDRLALFRARAGLARDAGQLHLALVDLEQAFAIAPAAVASELEHVLSELIDEAVRRADDKSQQQLALRFVDVILTQGRREEALKVLSDWLARMPNDVAALRRLRDIDIEDGRWPEVMEACRRLVAIDRGPAQIEAALGLSRACQELGEPDRAREGLELVRSAQPDNAHVRAELRTIYEREGDRRALAALLVDDGDAAQDRREKVELLRRAGMLFMELGDAEAGVRPLRTAYECMPDDAAGTLLLADAYILAGWFDEANQLLDRVLAESAGRRGPEVASYYHRKAQIAAVHGDEQAQLLLLQEAHACNKKNGEIAAELAELAQELRVWDLAAQTLRTITLLDTDCPIGRAEAFLRQGKIARMQGDTRSAKMWARRAKREDPDWSEVDAFLLELGARP